VYKTGRIGRFVALFARSSARSAVLAACGAMLVAGCNQVGTGGLSSNLPPAGGGGLLSFVSVSMPDAIAGRTYSKVAVTSVETQSKTNFPISPAIASGTAPLASCTVTSGSLPPGMNAALTIDPTGSGCLISGTPSATDAGSTYQFTIQALDSNSPPRAAAQIFAMKVRPEFTVTAPAAIVGGALPVGVQARSYGQIAGNAAAFTATTTLSGTNGNGPVGAKNYCALTVTPALPSLTMTQVSGTNNCALQGSGTLAAAGSYKVSIALTDNPITDPETNLPAVPANTIAGALNASLNVGTPLKIVAQSDGVSATPPAAVQGRAYGTGSGCSGGACLPLTYVATGGLPSVETADAYLFTDSGLAAAGLNCTATAASTVAKTTCSGTAGASGTTSFSVTVDDAGNLATPGGSASGTTSTLSGLSLTVDSTLSLAVSPDPATNPAVQSTAYGIGTGCTGPGGNCVAPTYTPTGGLGSYSFSVTGSAPAGITCAANGGNTAVVCSGTASATAATSTFGVSASDVANASSPSATTSPVSKTLTVSGALTLTPPASLLPAVSGRAFGTGAGCSGGNCVPAVFTISGGLGTYAANATIVSAPGAWTCPLSGSQYNCSSALVGSGTTLSITASDGATATTPGQTTASASVPITVNAALVLAPPATVNDAVTGRPYGTGSGCTGGSCVALQYALTGGLGTYGTPVLTAGPNTFACTGTGTYTCSIATISGSGAQTLSMAIPDSSNASTPTATATDTSKSITIDGKVALANANLGTTWPDAVQNRSYAGSGFTVDQFTATGGIGAYAFLAPGGFPTGFSCVTAATTDTCSATSVGTPGSYGPQITVHDTGNASTPQSTVTTDAGSQFTASLTVKPTVTVTPPNLSSLPAVTGRPFGSGSGCSSGNCQPAVFTVAGGLGTYAATANAVASPGTWTCTLSGTNYNCSSTSVSGSGPNSLTIDVADIANSTTPAATTTTDANSQSTATVTVDAKVTLTAPTGLVTAVNGRAYGTGTGCPSGGGVCQPAVFTVVGGLGTYAPAVVTGAPGGAPGSWSCTLASLNYNCFATSVGGSGPSSVTIFAADSPNPSTPAATTTTDPASQATASITVNNVMALTPPGTVNDAVIGRSYGVGSGCGGACTGITYVITGGLGNYGTGSLIAGTDTFLCSFTTPNYTCTKATITSAAGSHTLTMSTSETGNVSTPSGTATNNTVSLSVDPVLTISASQGSSWLPAVQGRSYGLSGTPNQATAAGGIPSYTYIYSGFPAGITCTPLVTSLPTACSSNNVTDVAASYAPVVEAIDSSNGSTPQAVAPATTGPNSLTVDAQLAINSITLPNALENYPYPTPNPTNPSPATLTATGGLGGNAWAAPGSPAGGCTPTGSFPPSSNPTAFAIDGSTGAITGTPTSASTSVGQYNFVACAADTQNSMTPAGSANSASLVIDVIFPLAYVTESGEVQIVNTQSKTIVGSDTPGTPVPSAIPWGAAFSPSGRFAYLTLNDVNELAIYDTINSPHTATLVPLGSTCLPEGVGATATYIFVACNNSGNIAVVNATSHAVTTIATDSGGSAPTSIAVSPDQTRVYVTLSNENEMFVINSSGTPSKLIPVSGTNPVALSSDFGTTPVGIAIAPIDCSSCSAGTLAYIAEENAGTGPDGVIVENVTGDSFSTTPYATVQTSSDGSAVPSFAAVTPDNARVYVTLEDLNKFAVIDNTKPQGSLGLLGGSLLNLTGPGTLAQGVAIPPLAPGDTLQAFIAESGLNQLGVINNSATPTETTPVNLAIIPFLIATTPAPE
jgi:hypothetical protein